MTAEEFFDVAQSIIAEQPELGSIKALEDRLDELVEKTPAGVQKMLQNWGKTPEAKAAMANAESQFGIRR